MEAVTIYFELLQYLLGGTKKSTETIQECQSQI
jgi:hypothetical protein